MLAACAAALFAALQLPIADSELGVRWRLKLHATGHFVHADPIYGHVNTSSTFFTLFRLQRSATGAHHLVEDATGAPLGASHDARRLALHPVLRARNKLHANLNGAATKISKWRQKIEANELAAAAFDEQLSVMVEQRATGLFALKHMAAPTPDAAYVAVPAAGLLPIGGGHTALFELERIADATNAAGADAGAGAAPAEAAALLKGKLLARRIREQHAFSVRGRPTVLVAAYDLSDLGSVPLFWRWLRASGAAGYALVHTDEHACAGTRALLCAGEGARAGGRPCALPAPQLECVGPAALALPEPVADAAARREWLADDRAPDWELDRGNTNVAKLLQRCRLRLAELLLLQGADVIALEPSVLVLSPHFFAHVSGTGKHDLSILSDARQRGHYDWAHCALSDPMYHQYASDWLSPALFHARAGERAADFLKQAQRWMDDFALTDADVFQALLTGHAQLSDPLRARRTASEATYRAKAVSAVGSSAAKQERFIKMHNPWLKPFWLEGERELQPWDPLVSQRGIRPLNAPLKAKLWQRLTSERKTGGFTWRTLPRERFANGPAMVAAWAAFAQQGGGFLAVQAGCQTQARLVNEPGHFLLSGQAVQAEPGGA